MKPTHRLLRRTSVQILSLFLAYSFIISLCAPLQVRTANAAVAREAQESPSPQPSASPTPESTPEASPVPTPEPTPSATPVTAPSPTQGAPAPTLPNLDTLRQVQPTTPEAPEPVPSTQCSPAQPDCQPSNRTTTSNFSHALRSKRLAPTRLRVDASAQEPMLAFNAKGSSRDMTEALPLLEPQTNTGSYDDFVMARLDPDNRIGTGGEDVLSRNFNWSLPLVSMAGRSGLNLGLSLSYNSLVWTKAGNYITYDADNGYPTPGFRLGFPVIEGTHYNSQTGTNGYLMLLPSGARIELRQVGSTNFYEAADSSYLQLTDNGNGTLLVRSTDGAQLSYAITDGGYRCTQVKDRNGNYLTITNDSKGRILTITDTLGRVFNFHYDTNHNLSSITQTRGTTEYPWVTLGYTNLTIQTNFTNLTQVGLQSGTSLPVLSQVGLRDGTYYKFSYNTWGQVSKITKYAADSDPQTDLHPLNYVTYNLPPNATTAQTDCPRFTQRKDWAENWNSGNEAVTNYTAQVSASLPLPGETTPQSFTFCQMQTPDGTYYNYYYHSSGWDEGMTIMVNTWADNDQQNLVLQRQAVTSYDQDNTNLSYMLNPRVKETNIYDAGGNHKRVGISYSSFTLTYGSNTLAYYLPYEIKEYDQYAVNALRTTQSDYNLSSSYTSRRIFGLPSQKRVYDNGDSNKLISKIDYIYDEGGEFLAQQGTPVQHDTANYGTGFTTGRGNLTTVRRWSVSNPLPQGEPQSLDSQVGYNTTGSPIFSRDPLNHQQSISYADSFSNIGNMNTYAFPTMMTDADGYQAAIQYDYNFGVVTRRQGQPTNTTAQTGATGAYITYLYDSVGRLYQTVNSFNGGKTYFVYPNSSNVIQTYITVIDSDTYTVASKILDGVGRVRAIAAEHPGTTTSTGGYIGQITIFDVMGRVRSTSNPTEIYGTWQPAGDDATTGWVYTTQTYDWKGRPRVTTLPSDASVPGGTREATYDGCGCAGGEVVTLRDEVNRYSKVYHDVLGRATKAEELNWDQTVYRTMTTAYNALDQVTQFTEQQGSNGIGQSRIMTYDGYDRLKTQHVPENASNAVTTYDYNNDNTLQKVTDARGATTSYSYNNRQLVTDVSYSVPLNSNIIVPHAINYTYDAAGNRLSMTDSLGTVSYSYDQLSHLTSETRTIDEISKSYTLNYGYNVGGELTSLSDPNDTNRNVTYTYNQTGALSAVTGNGFANLTQPYASNLQYRAWGALKHLTYGNGKNLDYQYGSRLQISRYEVSGVMGATFQYYADGRLSFVGDLNNPTSDPMLWDRSYSYDQVGRLTTAKSGPEAHNPPTTTTNRPYNETLGYDVWNHLTSRTGQVWYNYIEGLTAQYTNNRRSDEYSNWQYDVDGRPTVQDTLTNTYDASGRKFKTVDTAQQSHTHPALTIIQGFDGNGQRVKQNENNQVTYLVRSTALGGEVVSEIALVASNSGPTTWQKKTGFVYGGGGIVAILTIGLYGNTPLIEWRHENPVTGSQRWTLSSGQPSLGKETELDPLSLNAGLFAPDPGPGPYNGGESELVFPKYGDILNGSTGCEIDGAVASCDQAAAAEEADAATRLPDGVGTIDIVIDRNTGLLHTRDGSLEIDPNTGELRRKRRRVDDNKERPEDQGVDADHDGYDDITGNVHVRTDQDDDLGHWEYSYERNLAHGKGQPCPPTGQDLALNTPAVTEALDQAFALSLSSKVERGGWIFWNPKTGKVLPLIKDPPTINPLKPNLGDTYFQVYLDKAPAPPKGFVIIATFHTHPEDLGQDDWDDAAELGRKVPGIIRSPTKIFWYGRRRGIWMKELPAKCWKN